MTPSPMHPHWQSTDDEQEVPVRAAHAEREAAPAAIRVSRAPAAIVGILFMVGVVAFTYGGLGELIGQLANPTPDVTISITRDGFDPASATIRPGQTIRWVNNDPQIPQVLASETLPTQDGTPFNSPGIFPSSDFFYTIPAGAVDGTHAYVSETSPDLEGEIVISAAAAPTSSAASSASSASSVFSAPAVASSSQSSLPNFQNSSVPMLPASSVPSFPPVQQTSSVSSVPLQAGVLAVNPYVVGRQTGSKASAKPAVTQHKPTGNTESGPAVWIVLACAAAALVVVTRSAFRKV